MEYKFICCNRLCENHIWHDCYEYCDNCSTIGLFCKCDTLDIDIRDYRYRVCLLCNKNVRFDCKCSEIYKTYTTNNNIYDITLVDSKWCVKVIDGVFKRDSVLGIGYRNVHGIDQLIHMINIIELAILEPQKYLDFTGIKRRLDDPRLYSVFDCFASHCYSNHLVIIHEILINGYDVSVTSDKKYSCIFYDRIYHAICITCKNNIICDTCDIDGYKNDKYVDHIKRLYKEGVSLYDIPGHLKSLRISKVKCVLR